STVNGSELRLFDTSQAPYTDFAAKSPQFLRDKAIKSALSYMRTGLVHAKFQWKLWQTGSETISLPFVLDTTLSTSTAPVTEAVAEADEAEVMLVDEESDGSTLVTNMPQDPTSAVSTTNGIPDDTTSAPLEEADTDRTDKQNESDGNVSPNSSSGSSSTRSAWQSSSRSITRSRSSGNLTPVTSSPAKNSPQAASPSPQPEEPISATTETTDGDKEDDDNGGDGDGDGEGEGDDEEDTPLQQQQQQAMLSATPASTATAATTPETASPPHQTQQPQPATRARRGRQPRVTANGTNATTGTGTGRRGRPPLANKQHNNQNGAKNKRNTSSAVASTGPGRRGPTVITDSTSVLAEDSDNPAVAAGSSEIKRIVREMMDVQEEYRFFKVLVKRAAKDLWSEMGNEWPPNLGSSTRFGKRRKLA
ncbi:hypothetical protein GGI05_004630, partial [Coemansia sp. RSA 2603]